MNIVSDINEWIDIRKQLANATIGFVPTMGNLHQGHLSLCQRAKTENQLTVVSIFINPMQFNQSKDFELYPRTLEADIEYLNAQKIDYLFLPKAEQMYPDHYEVQVTETTLSHELEGQFRPGHFTGVLTVVLKLLNLIQASRAYFGEKDFQQLMLIQKMAKALFLPVEIVSCPTVRAEDDVALSSRNSRLNPEQRKKAANFPAILRKDTETDTIHQLLQQAGFKPDYVAEKWGRRLAAVWLDEVRLIDNISIK